MEYLKNEYTHSEFLRGELENAHLISSVLNYLIIN